MAALLKKDKTLKRVITATTRAPRKGERNGRDYHFWTVEQFEKAIKAGKMAEWAKVHNNYYGIPKSSFGDISKAGKHPVLVIDVQGAKTVRKEYKNALAIFIAPPSLKVLEQRIAARNDGTQNIQTRLKTAKKEMEQIRYYDYLVINDKFEEAVEDTQTVIKAEKMRINRIAEFLKK